MTDKKSLGENIRDLINPALEDQRRQDIQNGFLNDMLEQIVENFEMAMEQKFRAFFNHVAARSEKVPQIKTPMVLEAITKANPQTGETKYSPILRIPLPISTSFTAYSADDVKELPNYIRLHEKARDMDVAIKLLNLTADESKASPYSLPPLLIIDGSKSYNDGAAENMHLYPDLPEKKAPFDKSSGQEFKL